MFTHDLDFSAILAATQARAPSVIQLRTQDVLPTILADATIAAIRQFEQMLVQGALVVVNPNKARARILPIQR